MWIFDLGSSAGQIHPQPLNTIQYRSNPDFGQIELGDRNPDLEDIEWYWPLLGVIPHAFRQSTKSKFYAGENASIVLKLPQSIVLISIACRLNMKVI